MVQNFIVGTPTGQKHEHFVGISYLIGLDYKGGHMGYHGISLSLFLLMCFFGALS